MPTFLKDPSDRLDYTVDFKNLIPADDVINLSTWAIEPQGAGHLVSDGSDVTGLRTRVWLKGGMAGMVYSVTNTVASIAGREAERTFSVRVLQR